MEAVPRLPMISFQLKVSPETTAFGPKLKQYIRDFYNEDPESYSNEIHQLENLRAMAVRPPIAVAGCSLLQKYYCQLHFLQSRFPMGPDEAAAVMFTWKDTYANMVCSLANIRFEIISILYNIGAVHTQLGAKTERTTAEGMKMACSHFQWAAWAFEHVQSDLSGLDLAPELMTFMHQLSLAQAQECILEKSMLDNRKPTIVAKVAKQIVDYYSQALATLEPNSSEDNPVSDTVGSKIYKNWKRYVKFKRAYHLAVTQLYQGLAAEEQQKMGERVAFYNASLAALNDARSMYTSAKGPMGITGNAGEKEAIEEALTFTNDVIEGKRKAAKNENEFIYHEEVPEKDVLPTVNGASLVKGIPFSVNDPEVSGPDIFARLVPMKVHEASSLYSEEKAKILRSVGAKIEEKDQQLDSYLSSLKLQNLSLWDPDAQNPESDFLPLPEELAERCAALNARPNAIQDLVDIMGKLSDTYRDVEAMLKEIAAILNEEEQREKQYQESMGKRPPTIVATDLTREAKKYEEAHAKASESNQALHRAMTLHVNNLQVLAQPLADLIANIPSPSANLSGQKSDEIESNKAHARELKRILAKVDEMQRQRNELHAKLRDSVAQDDLTRLLVTATAESASLEALFAEQIGKHQSLVSLIDQNLSAQENILAALTDAYARTADTRKLVDEVLKRREFTISSLVTSYDAYEDLLAKSTKGLEFYRKLEVNVTKLLQRVKSTCRVQEEEREQILARNDKTAYGSAEGSIGSTGTERKPGSGMTLRDHLAARLKNNNYQQNNYGTEKHAIPVAPIQPNPHGSIKPIYPMDPTTGGQEPSGIPVHAVPPITSELQPAVGQQQQQIYQQYYPSDYSSYYMAQQPQAQYHPHQYQYGEEPSLTNGGGTRSFPKTGTTNTDSMYRQATGNSTGSTEVSSNSTRYAGYSNARTDKPSPSPIVANPASQYPVGAVYDNNADYTQYPSDYRTVQEPHGYQMHEQMSVQPVSDPAASSAVQPAYNPVVNVDQSPSHVQQNSGQQISATNAYRAGQVRQDVQQPQNVLHQPHHPVQLDRPYVSPYQVVPQASQQSPMQQHPQPSDSPAAHGYSYPQINQIPPHVPPSKSLEYSMPDQYVQQNATISTSDTSIHSSMYPAAMSNAYYGNTVQASNQQQQQQQQQQVSTDYANQQQQNYPDGANPQSVHVSQLPASRSVQSFASQPVPTYTSQPVQTFTSQPVQNYTSQPAQTYTSQPAQTYTSQPAQTYTSQPVQTYTSQPVQSYTSQPVQSYGNYKNEAGDHRYPIASSVPSQVAGAGYSNDTEIIQSHTKSTSNQGYLQNYQYPNIQGHNSGVVQYQNYSQAYGNNYANSSQPVLGVHGSLTDSYKGHPGYAYDPSSGSYSYSSGYQDSHNGTGAERTNEPGATFVLPSESAAIAQQGQVYGQQEHSATTRYTNASNGATTNLTPSSQYSNGSYQSSMADQNYYTNAYGPQSENQSTTASNDNQSGSSAQTYAQRPNAETSSATTEQPIAVEEPASKSQPPKSNLDLLSELDLTINHAPLVPEVHSVDKLQKDVAAVSLTVLPEKNEKSQEPSQSQILDDKHENLQIVWDTWYTDVQPKRDPLGDPATLQKFVADIEKYEKFVESLTVKTLSGSTNLDIKWSEIIDVEARESKRQTSYVAQAHSTANRTTNLVPYDSTRVRLTAQNLSSDYINASHVNDLTQWTPGAFIVAQSPKPESFEAFWTMIWEQGSEVIACLATDAQSKDETYWPTSKENSLTVGCFTISLKSSSNHSSYVQRVISMVHSESRMERVVVHMQYIAWPSTGLPSSPGSLLAFATDILSEQALRHCSPKPIVVHCLHGGSLSALFLLAAAAVCHVRAGHGAVDVPLVFSTLVKYRRCMIDRDSLLFGYRMVLYHAQDTLMKRGILSSTRSTFQCFESMKGNKGRAMKKPQHCHPSDDFLHNLGGGMQQGEQSIGQTNSQTKIAKAPQEKTDKIDPLSQLDPLWSIRR